VNETSNKRAYIVTPLLSDKRSPRAREIEALTHTILKELFDLGERFSRSISRRVWDYFLIRFAIIAGISNICALGVGIMSFTSMIKNTSSLSQSSLKKRCGA
jgi:hypothetical protein